MCLPILEKMEGEFSEESFEKIAKIERIDFNQINNDAHVACGRMASGS